MIIISNILMTVAVASALFAVASAVMIGVMLQNRGFAADWVWFSVKLLTRYLSQYREITHQETGRVGPLFYAFTVAINLAPVTAISSLILRVT
jgi:hypothetical protein